MTSAVFRRAARAVTAGALLTVAACGGTAGEGSSASPEVTVAPDASPQAWRAFDDGVAAWAALVSDDTLAVATEVVEVAIAHRAGANSGRVGPGSAAHDRAARSLVPGYDPGWVGFDLERRDDAGDLAFRSEGSLYIDPEEGRPVSWVVQRETAGKHQVLVYASADRAVEWEATVWVHGFGIETRETTVIVKPGIHPVTVPVPEDYSGTVYARVDLVPLDGHGVPMPGALTHHTLWEG